MDATSMSCGLMHLWNAGHTHDGNTRFPICAADRASQLPYVQNVAVDRDNRQLDRQPLILYHLPLLVMLTIAFSVDNHFA